MPAAREILKHKVCLRFKGCRRDKMTQPAFSILGVEAGVCLLQNNPESKKHVHHSSGDRDALHITSQAFSLALFPHHRPIPSPRKRSKTIIPKNVFKFLARPHENRPQLVLSS